MNQSLQKMIMESCSNEIFGFLKLIFVNNIILNKDHLSQITKLLKGCSVAFSLFCNSIQNFPFKLREEVVERLPKVGFIFHNSFLKIIKETKGDIFIRFPDKYRESFIQLIIYACEENSDIITEFLIKISDYIYQYGILLEKALLLEFISEFIQRLKQQNILWVHNLNQISFLFERIIYGIIEKKIISTKILIPCLDGDFSILENELNKSKTIDMIDVQQLISAINKFKKLNTNNKKVQIFELKEFNQEAQKLFREIENIFGRPFHNLQIMCIKFLLSAIGNEKLFIQFGLGNGKTLISAALAIMICKLLKKPVIILVKSPYLLYRDYKKFKNIIENCGIMTAYQSYLDNGIAYLDEKSFYKLIQKKTKKDKILFQKQFLIMDEYDSLFDDQKPFKIVEKINTLSFFNNIIAFTGSTLSQEECNCLELGLNGSIIKFPLMNENGDLQLLQRRSLVYTIQQIWLENLASIALQASEQVPVIIALNQNDILVVRNFFNGISLQYFDLTEYVKKLKFAELQTLIEKQFSNIIKDNLYGIYLINAELGRGTDFPTSVPIENNGGIYLILGDVFSPRITEQIKGRVSRMQNKGQYQYIISMKQEGNSFDYIQNRTNIVYLNTQTNNEIILTKLRQNLNQGKVESEYLQQQIYEQVFFDQKQKDIIEIDQILQNNDKEQTYLTDDSNFTISGVKANNNSQKKRKPNEQISIMSKCQVQQSKNIIPLKRKPSSDTYDLMQYLQKQDLSLKQQQNHLSKNNDNENEHLQKNELETFEKSEI